MAGCFPGVSNTQQHDLNGVPMAACLLTVYQGGTTQLSSTFQDIGLTLPAPNPLVADASGRIPLFFVADGTYAVRLTDQYGVQSNGGFYYPQIPSIGASTSGGGGTPVDPTTVASTGDLKWRLENTTIAGWVRINGRTVGNATSGATERANADCQALFIYIWSTYADAICPVLGGRGASALADFSASKQITLLDGRDRSIAGLDDMGNAALGGLALAAFTKGNATTGGSSGGESAHVLATTEMPAHSHGVTDNGHVHTINNIPRSTSTTFTGNNNQVYIGSANGGTSLWNTDLATTGITINPAGGGGAHNNMPPFLLGTLFWKL